MSGSIVKPLYLVAVACPRRQTGRVRPSHLAATLAPCSSTLRRPMPGVISHPVDSPKNLRPHQPLELGHNNHGDSAAPLSRSEKEKDAFITHDRARGFLSAPSPPTSISKDFMGRGAEAGTTPNPSRQDASGLSVDSLINTHIKIDAADYAGPHF